MHPVLAGCQGPRGAGIIQPSVPKEEVHQMKLRGVMTVLALSATLPAFAADTVNVQLSGFKYGSGKSATITNTIGSYSVSTLAGEYAGTLDGQSFSTFCTDVYQYVSLPSSLYQYDRLSVADTQQLWGNAPYNPNSYGLVSKLFTTAYSSVNNSTTSAAFQYALWELLYEKSGSYSIGNTGNFWLTNTDAAAASQANVWLASLASASEGYAVQSLYSGAQQSPANRQDLVIATPVPEPQTYALALVSMGIVAGYARRKRDKS